MLHECIFFGKGNAYVPKALRSSRRHGNKQLKKVKPTVCLFLNYKSLIYEPGSKHSNTNFPVKGRGT